MIRFACPHCRAEYECPDHKGGFKLNCRRCGQRLQVPVPSLNKTIVATEVPPRWYLSTDNKTKEGPFTLKELRQLRAAGRLHATHMLLQEGTQQWMEAGSLGELFPVAAPTSEPAQAPAPRPSIPTRTRAARARRKLRLRHLILLAAIIIVGVVGWIGYRHFFDPLRPFRYTIPEDAEYALMVDVAAARASPSLSDEAKQFEAAVRKSVLDDLGVEPRSAPIKTVFIAGSAEGPPVVVYVFDQRVGIGDKAQGRFTSREHEGVTLWSDRFGSTGAWCVNKDGHLLNSSPDQLEAAIKREKHGKAGPAVAVLSPWVGKVPRGSVLWAVARTNVPSHLAPPPELVAAVKVVKIDGVVCTLSLPDDSEPQLAVQLFCPNKQEAASCKDECTAALRRFRDRLVQDEAKGVAFGQLTPDQQVLLQTIKRVVDKVTVEQEGERVVQKASIPLPLLRKGHAFAVQTLEEQHKEVVRRKHQEYERLVGLGGKELEAEHYAEAIRHFEEALAVLPGNKGAEDQLQQARKAKTDREEFDAHVRQGKEALAAGNLARSIQEFEAALQLRGGDQEAREGLTEARYREHMRRGKEAFGLEEFDRAIGEFTAALQVRSKDKEAEEQRAAAVVGKEYQDRMAKGQEAMHKDHYPEAIRELVAARGLFPGDQDRIRKAEALLRAAVEAWLPKYQRERDHHLGVARKCMKDGDDFLVRKDFGTAAQEYERAVEHFERAGGGLNELVKVVPDDLAKRLREIGAEVEKVEAELKTARYRKHRAQGLEHLRKANEHVATASSHKKRDDYAKATTEFEQAVKEFKRALQECPGDPDTERLGEQAAFAARNAWYRARVYHEDFRSTTVGKLPPGWDGDQSVHVHPKGGRWWLQTSKTGPARVHTPILEFADNYELEVAANFQDRASLDIILEDEGGIPKLMISHVRRTFSLRDGAGKSEIASFERTSNREASPFDRIRLVRDDNTYRLIYQDEVHLIKHAVPEPQQLRRITLSLSEGTQVFGVTLSPHADKRPAVPAKSPYKEDFRSAKKGFLPNGWTGDDSVGVEQDFSLAAGSSGMHWVATPPLHFPPEFALDVSTLLNGYSKLALVLEGEGNSPDLVVNIAPAPIFSGASSALHASLTRASPKEIKTEAKKLTPIRLRRQGEVYFLEIPGNDVITHRLPDHQRFRRIILGLNGPERVGFSERSATRIYSLSLSPLSEQDAKGGKQ